MNDSCALDRFLTAQAPIYPAVLRELRAGRKESHWMWFVFPQLRGLGRSSTAERYGIADVSEARAYLAHETLGARLRECTQLVLAVEHGDPHRIFGSPDDFKFRSSMTLFDAVAPGALFAEALAKFYAGARDPLTLALLAKEGAGS
jgi:uncharacterized protein (DUF1810 family)